MKSLLEIARDIAHPLVFKVGACPFPRLDFHSSICDDHTGAVRAAIESRDAEHAAEVARWLRAKSAEWEQGGRADVVLVLYNLALEAKREPWHRPAAPAVVPAEAPPEVTGEEATAWANAGRPRPGTPAFEPFAENHAKRMAALAAPAVRPVPEGASLAETCKTCGRPTADLGEALDGGEPGEKCFADVPVLWPGLNRWRQECRSRARATPPTPSAPPAPTQHHAYRCSKCGREETSGPLPKPPQLPVFPLPPGWALVPVADLNVDDDLHCDTCAAPSAPPREGMGPPASLRHDAGAYARCSYCGRYSLDPKTLGDRPPRCDCGSKHGWSGSFVAPGPDAFWSGTLPASTPPGPGTPGGGR